MDWYAFVLKNLFLFWFSIPKAHHVVRFEALTDFNQRCPFSVLVQILPRVWILTFPDSYQSMMMQSPLSNVFVRSFRKPRIFKNSKLKVTASVPGQNEVLNEPTYEPITRLVELKSCFYEADCLIKDSWMISCDRWNIVWNMISRVTRLNNFVVNRCLLYLTVLNSG